jgi:hypothetical protein
MPDAVEKQAQNLAILLIMCYLLPFNIAIVCLLLSVYLLLSRFPIRPTTASFPLHWGEKFTRTLLKAGATVT